MLIDFPWDGETLLQFALGFKLINLINCRGCHGFLFFVKKCLLHLNYPSHHQNQIKFTLFLGIALLYRRSNNITIASLNDVKGARVK